MSTPAVSGLSTTVRPSASTTTGPTDTLLSVPAPILKLVIAAEPLIKLLENVLCLLNWDVPSKGYRSPFASFLLLTSWILLCLAGEYTFKYGLNALAIFSLLFSILRSKSTKKRRKSYNATIEPAHFSVILQRSNNVTAQLAKLRAAYSPLIDLFASSTSKESKLAAITFLATTYPAYIFLTRFLPLRYIAAFVGSIVITYQAPWALRLRKLLWRSASIRWIVNTTFAVCRLGVGTGVLRSMKQKNLGLRARLWQYISLAVRQTPPIVAAESKEDILVGTETQFLFTVFENQRWWVGLDWTQALLPSERPSWSDPTHAASVPPSAFQLPVRTSHPHPHSRSLRIVHEWKWLDSAWSIKGSHGVAIPASLPTTTGAAEEKVPSGAEKELQGVLMSKGAGALSRFAASTKRLSLDGKRNSVELASSPPGSPISPTVPAVQDGKIVPEPSSSDAQPIAGHPVQLDPATVEMAVDDEDWLVDSSGWQYGDNSWEKLGAKGGMGRYTRRRAWIRRAICVEREVESSELGKRKSSASESRSRSGSRKGGKAE